MPKSVQDKMGIGFSTVALTEWEWDTQANLANPPWDSPITIISLWAADLAAYSIGPIMGFSVWKGSGGPTSRINTFSASALITPLCHHWGKWEMRELIEGRVVEMRQWGNTQILNSCEKLWESLFLCVPLGPFSLCLCQLEAHNVVPLLQSNWKPILCSACTKMLVIGEPDCMAGKIQ